MGETRLEGGRGCFERNKVDVFEIMGSAVGTLKEATVRMVSFGWTNECNEWWFEIMGIAAVACQSCVLFIHLKSATLLYSCTPSRCPRA